MMIWKFISLNGLYVLVAIFSPICDFFLQAIQGRNATVLEQIKVNNI
jgi:hypothetical protein